MKVLLIAPVDFPVSRSLKHAGTERVVLALTTELQLLGIDVIVCCSGDSDELGGARYVTVERAQHSRGPVANTRTNPSGVVPDLGPEIIVKSPNTEEE